jgi:hypothetical protein
MTLHKTPFRNRKKTFNKNLPKPLKKLSKNPQNTLKGNCQKKFKNTKKFNKKSTESPFKTC